MNVSEIQLYNILKEKLGESEAQSLVEFVDSKIDKGFNDKKDVLATKQDISGLRVEFGNFKAEIIKWMFIFWIGQVAAVVAIVKFVL